MKVLELLLMIASKGQQKLDKLIFAEKKDVKDSSFIADFKCGLQCP